MWSCNEQVSAKRSYVTKTRRLCYNTRQTVLYTLQLGYLFFSDVEKDRVTIVQLATYSKIDWFNTLFFDWSGIFIIFIVLCITNYNLDTNLDNFDKLFMYTVYKIIISTIVQLLCKGKQIACATACFSSKQLLLFVFTWQISHCCCWNHFWR